MFYAQILHCYRCSMYKERQLQALRLIKMYEVKATEYQNVKCIYMYPM